MKSKRSKKAKKAKVVQAEDPNVFDRAKVKVAIRDFARKHKDVLLAACHGK